MDKQSSKPPVTETSERGEVISVAGALRLVKPATRERRYRQGV